MGRPTFILLLLIAAIGGWFVMSELSLQDPSGRPLGTLTPTPVGPTGGGLGTQITNTLRGGSPRPPTRPAGVIRVATMNLDNFDNAKAARNDIVGVTARIVSNFDVVALQDITSGEQNAVPALVDAANALGCDYDFVVGPRVGRQQQFQQFAFIYDKTRIEVDRYELYSVQDPDDLLKYEPFVAWFRVRGVDPQDAFTFSLVNMLVDPEEAPRENGITPAVFDQVRNDRRGEDDVILLGDFAMNATDLQKKVAMPSGVFIIRDAPTNPQHDRSNVNIIVDRHATVELTGRSGVFDFLRELNLSMEQAVTISNHLPVWAEFSVYEGGQPGRVAANADEAMSVP
jgi:hypothetical protein